MSELSMKVIQTTAKHHEWQLDVLAKPVKLPKDMFKALSNERARHVSSKRFLDDFNSSTDVLTEIRPIGIAKRINRNRNTIKKYYIPLCDNELG